MATILIVEDEHNLSNLIRQHLEEEGHRVLQAFDGPSGFTTAIAQSPDLIILDIMLPGMDGLELCRRLRQHSIVPILMLTARAEEIDRVLGLEVGADDYLSKPFSMYELQARVRAILRRMEMMQSTDRETSDTPLEAAGLRLDPTSFEATLDGQSIDLTAKEFSLLYLLIRHPGRVYSRAYLLDRIWGLGEGVYDRTVDTHIYRLRRKLGANSKVARRIVSVRGVGYRFERE